MIRPPHVSPNRTAPAADVNPAATGANTPKPPPSNIGTDVGGGGTFSTVTLAVIGVLALLTLLRLFYGANAGLAEDEAHYWQWSRHLAWSYFDQGPGIAVCIRVGTFFFGDTPLGIRVVPILLGLGTGAFLYLTARRWVGEVAALWTVALAQIAPLFLVGSIVAGYDNPQVFCWTAALFFLTRTLQEDRLDLWYVVGLFVGLGALCKLTAILFAPCVLILLAWSPNYRRWLLSPHPYLAFGVTLLIFAPVVLWNAQNDWVAFKHWQALGSRNRGAAVGRWLGDFWGGQLLVLGPLLLLAELAALIHLARVRFKSETERFLLAFAAPILILCSAIALRSKMEINWPAPTHLAGLMAAGFYLSNGWATKRILPRIGAILAVATSLLPGILVLFPQLLPILVAGDNSQVSSNTTQKLHQTYGWEPLMAQIQQLREQFENRSGKTPVVVSGINYRTNSVLAFYLTGQPETHGLFFGGRRDQYYLWQKPKKLIGKNVLLCLDEKKDEAIVLARRYFRRVTLVEEIFIDRAGFDAPVKTWRIYECEKFKGYDPQSHVTGY